MRNKILVVERDAAAREQLEVILQEIVEEGGELIFTQKQEDALEIIKKQHPPVVLLESKLAEEDRGAWNLEGVHVILTYPRGTTAPAGSTHLFKPFKAHQVLEKCREYLSREFVPPIPPM